MYYYTLIIILVEYWSENLFTTTISGASLLHQAKLIMTGLLESGLLETHVAWAVTKMPIFFRYIVQPDMIVTYSDKQDHP